MKSRKPTGFSRREKEMMDVIYRLGQATVAEVREQMTHPPSYSSVRSTLSGLERKRTFTGRRFSATRHGYPP